MCICSDRLIEVLEKKEQTEINITSNCDASYYVLLIGTRKDISRFRGVEQDTIVERIVDK